MRTIPVNLYTFGELSDKAKEKALQELYFAAEYPWHDENHGTLKAIKKAFKLERFDWGYDVCGSWFCFEVPHDLKQGMGKKAINRLFDIYLNDGFWLTEFFKSDFMTAFETHGDIKQSLNVAIGGVIKACQKDMEEYFSEENLAEHATANEYEFNEDGNLA